MCELNLGLIKRHLNAGVIRVWLVDIEVELLVSCGAVIIVVEIVGWL